jgi:hypothetical protein
MAKVELCYDQLPLDYGQLEFSDDRESCRLLMACLLDHAAAERVEQVRFAPNDGDKCLAIKIGRDTYNMVPMPDEVRKTYLKFIHEMLLGRFTYLMLFRLCNMPFTRDNCGPITVDVNGRRSKWNVQCTNESVRFVRVS